MLFVYAMKTAFHYHYAQLTRDLAPAADSGEAVPTAIRSFSRAIRQDKVQAVAS
jgi:hypothetical protein